MTVHRFHVPGLDQGFMDLPESARIHAIRVLRLNPGDGLRVFDAGVEFEATIATVLKDRVVILVGGRVASLPERSVPLHLIMSPLKGDLTELVIQKATELGVSRISPAIFERTDTVARRGPADARVDRWRRVATSAAEQAGRTVVPGVDIVASLADATHGLGDRRGDEIRIVAMEPSLKPRAGDTPSPSRVRSVTLAVGPAGGLGPSDLETLDRGGFSPERLALHTLRSETACIAAVAIVGHRFPA